MARALLSSIGEHFFVDSLDTVKPLLLMGEQAPGA